MNILIYSDVHGNLPAFEAMLGAERDFDTTICLGDLVNYGPWSNECVDLARSLPSLAMIAGNHEEAYLAGAYPGENVLVQHFFQHTFPHFNRHKEIAGFIESYNGFGYDFRHTVYNKYIYPDTQVELDNNYVIGHSHHQFKYTFGSYTLFNAGSVGQNRAFINVANYLVLDTEKKLMVLKSVKYDVDKVISAMKAQKYPEDCINYYANKKKA